MAAGDSYVDPRSQSSNARISLIEPGLPWATPSTGLGRWTRAIHGAIGCERFDLCEGVQEVLREFSRGKASAHERDDPRAGRHHRPHLQRTRADLAIVGEHDPPSRGNLREPIAIGGVVPEMIGMAMDGNTRAPEQTGELVAPQVAVREEFHRLRRPFRTGSPSLRRW